MIRGIHHVAISTPDLDRMTAFYRDGLGFVEIGRFGGHERIDGVMFGHPRAPWHLEFTHTHGHVVGRAPTQDNLLVFYLPEKSEWEAAVERLRAQGYEPVPSLNPYWDRVGLTFEDPDGYRVVLQQAAWEA